MSDEYTDNIESIVEFGLDGIDPSEEVTVNLRDLVYVYESLNEYKRFLHQPAHYPNLRDIERFLGSINGHGGFKVLVECLNNKMTKMIPEHISDMYDEGQFDNPVHPFYYNSDRHE